MRKIRKRSVQESSFLPISQQDKNRKSNTQDEILSKAGSKRSHVAPLKIMSAPRIERRAGHLSLISLPGHMIRVPLRYGPANDGKPDRCNVPGMEETRD